MQPVHPKGYQSWVFIGRMDAKAEAPILWPPDVKNWLTGKDPDAGKDWGQEAKGTAEDEVTDSVDMSFSKLQEMVKDSEGWCAVVHGVAKSWTRQSGWTQHSVRARLSPSAYLALYNPLGCRLADSSSHGFLRQEYRSGLPFPSPGDLPDPGIKPTSLASPALAE